MALKTAKNKHVIHYGEIWGIVLIGFGIILFLSLYFYNPSSDPFYSTDAGSSGNYTGKLGSLIARSFFFILGLSAFVLPIFAVVAGAFLIARWVPKKPGLKILYLSILIVTSSCILHVQKGLPLDKWFPYLTEQNNMGFGGILGREMTGSLLVTILGRAGTSIVLIVVFLTTLLLITEVQMYPYLRFFYRAGGKVAGFVYNKLQGIFSYSKTSPEFGADERSGKVIRTKKKNENEADNGKERGGQNGGTGRKKLIEPKPVDTTPIVRKIVVPESTKGKISPKQRQATSPAMKMEYDAYLLPSTDLLKPAEPVSEKELYENINRNSEILEQTLLNFGIEAKVGEIHRGPVITRYELHPAPGVKVGKVVSLSDDIALAMKAPGVRIVAPIPGKSAIGIELPNSKANIVCLRELLESKEFQESKAAIPIALGKSIDGKVVIADLAIMPHLLIAGQTGSGKSVCINTVIMTMLYTMRPDQVKFIMVDPKKIELAMYNVLPHLLVPVITDSKKVANGLNWLVIEMEKRYEYLAKAGARNIESYNARPIERKQDKENGDDAEEIPDRLPYIVAIIDELADLMMVSPQDVENGITRLAQLSRAVGIHLIIATQRPSVNVITGVIKANLPSRISFQVASKVDSRTVLDANGAEKLIGNGDSLFMPPGTAHLIRVQGTYVSDNEIKSVLDFIKQQAEPEFDHSILEKQQPTSSGDMSGDGFDDELYDDAVEITLLSGQASASNLQRRLRIGYARAARLIDIMEERGVIGPARGSKPRDIYALREEGGSEEPEEENI